MNRPTEMFLDEARHPPPRTSIVFEEACFECDTGTSFTGRLTLTFRTFLADHPLQRLEEVRLDIDGTKSSSSWGDREGRSDFHLRSSLTDTTHTYTLQPFRARHRGGLLQRSWTLTPLPAVELHTASLGRQQVVIWASGLPHRDYLHPARSEPLACGSGSVRSHRYQLPDFLGGSALLDIFPGENTPQNELAREVASSRGEEPPEQQWLAFPDLSLHVTTLETTLTALREEFSLLCSMLTAITGHTLRLDAFHYPAPAAYVYHCALYVGGSERPRFRALPLGTGTSIGSVLAPMWPRVKLLRQSGFDVEAVSSWFDLGKCLGPVQQGFLNLFVYLESLKAHWLAARHGMDDTRDNFAGNVNRTLKEILGYKQKINLYVDYRNNLVHEGVTGLPFDEVLEHYGRLHQICASSYLSLLGWTGPYLAFDVQNNLARRTPRWTPPDLTMLQVQDP